MEAIVEREKKERRAAERELQRARQAGASKANAVWEQALGLQAGSQSFTLLQYQQVEAHLVETLARAAVDDRTISRLREELKAVKVGAHEAIVQCELAIELADQAKQARADDALVASAKKATESATESAATTMAATQAAARAIAGSAAALWRLVVSLQDANEDQANATVDAAVVLAMEAAKAAAESAAEAMTASARARVVARPPLTKVARNTKAAEAKATAVDDAGLVAAGGAATTSAAAGGLKGFPASSKWTASSKSYRFMDLNPFHIGYLPCARTCTSAVQVRAHVAQEVVSEAQRYALSQSSRVRRGKLHLWQAWAYKLVYISPRPFRYLGDNAYIPYLGDEH